MKIESVRALEVRIPRFGAVCLVEIVDEMGRRGMGQSGAWGHPSAVSRIVARSASLLIGADPRDIGLATTALTRALPFRGNLVASAVAAIDMALWDLRGRALEEPVWRLLGGRARRSARAHLIVRGATPDELAAAAADARDQGFDAIKLDPLAGLDDTTTRRARISGMRDRAAAARATAGDADLIFDLHRRLTPADAAIYCDALAEFDPLYIEDPLQIDSLDQQAALALRTTTPLAVGERLSSLSEFRELLSHHSGLVLRPDIGIAGGITGGRKIAALAEGHHTTLSPHNFLGPVITAATVHLATAIPNLLTVEYDLLDESPDTAWVRSDVRREGGRLIAGDTPGLGLEFGELPLGDPEPGLHLPDLLDDDGAVRHAI